MAKNEQKKNWLQRLWGWVRRWARRRQKVAATHPTILKRWYGENCAVLLLKRDTRGAIATYRIVPKDDGVTWLLTWDDLRERDTEAVGNLDGKTLKLRPPKDLGGYTHGFAVWRLPKGSTVPHLIGAWNIKLEQGDSYSARRRKKLGLKPIPSLIAEAIALHLKDMELVDNTWQERVSCMDWLKLLCLYTTPYYPNFTKKDCKKES